MAWIELLHVVVSVLSFCNSGQAIVQVRCHCPFVLMRLLSRGFPAKTAFFEYEIQVEENYDGIGGRCVRQHPCNVRIVAFDCVACLVPRQ